MIRLPSRFRRLDAILADLPVDDPMLLSELDGYLTGVALAPEPMQPAHWLPPIWGGAYGEAPPFEHPVDVRLFGDMVRARLEEIERDLARGKAQPIFDVEERDGEVLWEPWVGGFELAMGLCPESWSQMAEGSDADVAAAIERMLTLVDVAFDRSALMGEDINSICDGAPDAILAIVSTLRARRPRTSAPPAPDASSAKIGRNDPCACGSGKKHKRCCGIG